MATTLAVLASLVVIGWLIVRTAKGKPFKAHVAAYGLACVAGIFTLAFFLSMEIPQLIKIVVSILLGVVLIIVGSYFQHRRQARKP